MEEDGFTSLEVLRVAAQDGRRAHFTRIYSAPALLVTSLARSYSPLEESPFTDATPASVTDTTRRVPIMSDDLDTYDDESAIQRYAGRVAFLCKRPGNPFANMINVGRSAQCDVTIALGSVSKMHGYFLCEDGQWSFTDHRSTNGTTVNGRRVTPIVRTPIASGDQIRFGLGLTCRFLSPDALLRTLGSSSP